MDLILPEKEKRRLEALHEYQILDTLNEKEYDDLTRLASYICGCPIALISLVDRERQWFKSHIGIERNQTPIELSFCRHAIKTEGLFVIEDTLKDERFSENELVLTDPFIRFYAGAPLISPEGYALGTICVIDKEPRKLNLEQANALIALSRQAVQLLELRKNLKERNSAEELLKKSFNELAELKNSLIDRIELESIINAISAQFINLSVGEIDSGINQALDKIGTFAGVDRSYVFLYSDDGTLMSNTHEWCRMGIEPQIDNLKDIPADALPWWANKIRNHETIYIPVISDMPIEARLERELLEEQQIESLVVVPMISERKVVGFLGFDSVDHPKTWSEENISLLKNVGEIFVNALEKKKKDSELRITSSRLLTLVNNIQSAVLLEDSSRKIIHVNNQFCSLFGIPLKPEELTGYDCLLASQAASRLFADPEGFISRIDEILKNRQIVKTEELDLADGRTVERDYIPVSVEDNFIGHLWLYRDITNRKKQLKELISARQQAEESTRAKEQFLAHMSHEIRTPMNAVIGLTNLLLEGKPGGKELEYLSAIRISAENLLVIINDILDFSKIEAGKIEFEESSFVLIDIIDQVIRVTSLKAKEKGLLLYAEINDAIPPVLNGDPVRLNQVLLNLVSNAIRFTDQGEIRISAGIVNIDEEKVSIRMSVSDTGIGIPEDKLNIIFDSFSQVKDNLSFGRGGTGLGLTICKMLIELQNGKISVESRQGEGSTFYFELTFGINRNSDLSPACSKSRSFISSDLSHLNVLLVEDNEMNRLVAGSMLELWKAGYDTAPNGLAALEKMKSCRYDIILMDLSMPVMDGYEAASRIRSELNGPEKDIPIIALTAAALSDVRKKVFACGMDDYLTKPFKPEELLIKIVKLTGTAVNQETHGTEEIPVLEPSDVRGKSESIIDLSYLTEVSSGNYSFVIEMVENFLQQLPKAVAQMEKYLQAGDLAELKRLAHKTKPSFRYMGISQAEEFFEYLENINTEETDRENILGHILSVERVFNNAAPSLKLEINKFSRMNIK